MIRFRCGQCGATVTAPDDAVGRKGKCPQCGNVTTVPESGENASNTQPGEAAETPVYSSGSVNRGWSIWPVVAAGVVTAAIIGGACAVLIPRLGDSGDPPPRPMVVSSREDSADPPGDAETQAEPADAGDADASSDVPEQPDPVETADADTEADSEPPAQSIDEPEPTVAQTPPEPPADRPVRQPTGRWNPQSPADVQAVVFGSSDPDTADKITDMVALVDRSLLVCGVTCAPRDLIGSVPIHCPVGSGDIDGDCPFVAKLSSDLTEMEWLSVLPAGSFEPTRMAVGPDGSIYLGGGKGDEISRVAPNEDWHGRHSVIAKLSADGNELHWVRAGGPNQSGVTGLDVDDQGRVYWTAGTRGRSQAAYLLRLNADGSPSQWEYEGTRGWCVDLHHGDDQLSQEGQFWWFYRRGWNEGEKDGYFDYDGEGGWAPVKFWLRGIRQGGQVIVLPDGDIVVSGTMQYDFQVKGNKGFPAFDLLLARYRSDGKLLWSTNLYREGDSVHTPDQKAQDLHYDPSTGNLYVCAWQHGSNQYRFKGNLVGDTGNMSIYWVGRVNVENGDLLDGWYFHNVKPGSNGRFQADGTATGWPKLSGNYISRVRTDDRGRVYVTGRGAPVTWTCENAHQSWPGEQWSRYGFLYVLTPELDRILYATIIRGKETDAEGNVIGQSLFDGLAVTPSGVYVAGWTDIPTMETTNSSPLTSFFGVDVGDESPVWISRERGKADAVIVRFKWD